MRCLHDRAREIISTQDNLQKEVDHLARVLKQNGYPATFIRDASTPAMQETADTSGRDEEQEREKEPLTKRRLETRLKEHRDACERGMMEKSAVAEHAWENHHPIDWEETTILDRGRGQELLLKEALHIQMTPSEERFNRDGGLEVPGCWIAVMRRQGGRSNPHRPLTSDDVYPQ